jgi:hypothetical protein
LRCSRNHAVATIEAALDVRRDQLAAAVRGSPVHRLERLLLVVEIG